jgi:TetR/AcrR family transcriptional repressor of nem operon
MDRRQEIMARAAELIERTGYHGFSYADLATHVGIAKASVHHHFPHKEDLAIALLANASEFLKNRQREVTNLKDVSAWDRLTAFFEMGCSKACEGRVCLLTSLLSDFVDLPPSVQKGLRETCEQEVAVVTKFLEEGRAAGELGFVGDAATRAAFVVAVVKGSMFCARALGPDSVYHNLEILRRGLAGS